MTKIIYLSRTRGLKSKTAFQLHRDGKFHTLALCSVHRNIYSILFAVHLRGGGVSLECTITPDDPNHMQAIPSWAGKRTMRKYCLLATASTSYNVLDERLKFYQIIFSHLG